jgi:hypothetical protein
MPTPADAGGYAAKIAPDNDNYGVILDVDNDGVN